MSDITMIGGQPLGRRHRRAQHGQRTVPEPMVASRSKVSKGRGFRTALNRSGRVLLALVLVAAGVVCFLEERQLRFAETELLAWIMSAGGLAEFAASSVNNGIPAMTFQANDTWISLRVIPQCAIAMYLGAVLLLSAILILVPRVRPIRLLAALAVSGLGLILLNQIRLTVIAVMYAEGGREAFTWAHGPIGSAIMMVGVAGSLALFFILCIRRAKPSTVVVPSVAPGRDGGDA